METENELELEYLYTVGGYVTFRVRVRSGAFSGEGSFCLPRQQLRACAGQLAHCLQSLSGACAVQDTDSDDFLRIEMEKYGHASVSGKVGGCFTDQYLVFRLRTDQTEVRRIADTLAAFAGKEDGGQA